MTPPVVFCFVQFYLSRYCVFHDQVVPLGNLMPRNDVPQVLYTLADIDDLVVGKGAGSDADYIKSMASKMLM